MDRNQIVALVGAGLMGLGIGLGVGRVLTKRELTKVYEEELETEVQRTKAFYSKLHKADEYETPEKAVQALRAYTGDVQELGLPQIDESVEEEQAGIVIRDILGADEASVKKNIFRDPTKPYVIEEQTFLENDNGFEQVTLTYYMSDGVLADERDEAIPEYDKMLGNLEQHWIMADDGLTLLHIRNEAARVDYEIAKSEGSYRVEVLGLD